MNKRCARCEKTVYPIEELKCLDKVWHKGCFKCQECGMTLSMKTYKGFDKLPYCEAHIPKAKATTVAKTLEMKRLAENTKIQSNVQYHADFEKNKAKFTQIADDPETKRIKQNTKIISNVSYHGDLEKKAIMEMKRSDAGAEATGTAESLPQQNDFRQASQPAHSVQQLPPPQNQQSTLHHQSQTSAAPQPHSPTQKQQQQLQQPTQQQQQQLQQLTQQQQQQLQQPTQQQASYRNANASLSHSYATTPAPQTSNHYHHHYTPQQQPYYQSHQHSPPSNHSYEPQQQPSIQPTSYYQKGPVGGTANNYHHHRQNIGQNTFQDANHNSPYSTGRNSQTLIYSSQTGPVPQPQTNRIGSIADYDPINEQYGSIAQQKRAQQHALSTGHRQEGSYQGQRTNIYPEGNQSYPQTQQIGRVPPQSKVNAPPTHLGRCYRAIYDYEAADTDEVSFRDGDLLTNCKSIDEGWMMGTVQRTGQVGLLPANYVERAS